MKIQSCLFRASGRWRRFGADSAVPVIAPIACCACARPIAMNGAYLGSGYKLRGHIPSYSALLEAVSGILKRPVTLVCALMDGTRQLEYRQDQRSDDKSDHD